MTNKEQFRVKVANWITRNTFQELKYSRKDRKGKKRKHKKKEKAKREKDFGFQKHLSKDFFSKKSFNDELLSL